ncbi:hypothetical protein HK102_007431 [Quaeritorhiza haematococci]|nr:hypothetical protein HK102_007431 [Quaeritorhiza haematococci]
MRKLGYRGMSQVISSLIPERTVLKFSINDSFNAEESRKLLRLLKKHKHAESLHTLSLRGGRITHNIINTATETVATSSLKVLMLEGLHSRVMVEDIGRFLDKAYNLEKLVFHKGVKNPFILPRFSSAGSLARGGGAMGSNFITHLHLGGRYSGSDVTVFNALGRQFPELQSLYIRVLDVEEHYMHSAWSLANVVHNPSSTSSSSSSSASGELVRPKVQAAETLSTSQLASILSHGFAPLPRLRSLCIGSMGVSLWGSKDVSSDSLSRFVLKIQNAAPKLEVLKLNRGIEESSVRPPSLLPILKAYAFQRGAPSSATGASSSSSTSSRTVSALNVEDPDLEGRSHLKELWLGNMLVYSTAFGMLDAPMLQKVGLVYCRGDITERWNFLKNSAIVSLPSPPMPRRLPPTLTPLLTLPALGAHKKVEVEGGAGEVGGEAGEAGRAEKAEGGESERKATRVVKTLFDFGIRKLGKGEVAGESKGVGGGKRRSSNATVSSGVGSDVERESEDQEQEDEHEHEEDEEEKDDNDDDSDSDYELSTSAVKRKKKVLSRTIKGKGKGKAKAKQKNTLATGSSSSACSSSGTPSSDHSESVGMETEEDSTSPHPTLDYATSTTSTDGPTATTSSASSSTSPAPTNTEEYLKASKARDQKLSAKLDSAREQLKELVPNLPRKTKIVVMTSDTVGYRWWGGSDGAFPSWADEMSQ